MDIPFVGNVCIPMLLIIGSVRVCVFEGKFQSLMFLLTGVFSSSSFFFAVPGCGLPFAMQEKGSYCRIDSALRTSMDSFTTICKSLQRAKPFWWKEEEETTALQLTTTAASQEDEVIDLMADVNDHTMDYDNDDSSSRNSNSFGGNNLSLSDDFQRAQKEEDGIFETAEQ